MAAVSAPAAGAQGPDTEAQTEPARAEAPASYLSLAQVEGAWGEILHAVRQRNPLVEGALRTNCKPVEVFDDEIVIAFPYPFLRDKLGDPRRRAEIQDALAEVLGGSFRLKLVMESEYTPRSQGGSRPQTETSSPNPHPINPGETGLQPPGARASSPAAEAPPRSGAPEVEPLDPPPDEQAPAAAVPKVISDWAEERGAKARLIP